jgi:hypothetical protein
MVHVAALPIETEQPLARIIWPELRRKRFSRVASSDSDDEEGPSKQPRHAYSSAEYSSAEAMSPPPSSLAVAGEHLPANPGGIADGRRHRVIVEMGIMEGYAKGKGTATSGAAHDASADGDKEEKHKEKEKQKQTEKQTEEGKKEKEGKEKKAGPWWKKAGPVVAQLWQDDVPVSGGAGGRDGGGGGATEGTGAAPVKLSGRKKDKERKEEKKGNKTKPKAKKNPEGKKKEAKEAKDPWNAQTRLALATKKKAEAKLARKPALSMLQERKNRRGIPFFSFFLFFFFSSFFFFFDHT